MGLRRRTFATAALVLPLTACLPTPAPQRVGTIVAAWDQGTTPEVEEVWLANPHTKEFLFTTVEEWRAFTAAWPTALLETEPGLEQRLDFTDGFVVCGLYTSCMEQSRVTAPGEGKVRFEVYVAKEHENTACGWSPIQVEVWQLTYRDAFTEPGQPVELVD